MKASIAFGLALTTLLVHAQQAPGQTGGESGSGPSYGYGGKDPDMDGLYRLVMKADWSVNLPAKCNNRCVYQKDVNGNGMGAMGSGYGMAGGSGSGMGYGMGEGYGGSGPGIGGYGEPSD